MVLLELLVGYELYGIVSHVADLGVDPGIRELHANSFDMTDELLDKFFVSLPQIETAKTQLTPTVLRHIVTTHCLTRVALYQLHYPFVDEDLKSAAKGMSACKTVIASVAALPVSCLADADPLLAVSTRRLEKATRDSPSTPARYC